MEPPPPAVKRRGFLEIEVEIYCATCEADVDARLTDGSEIYPHRSDLSKLPFWRCDTCGGFVGCHHKTKNRTKPLGCIPTPEMKEMRKRIHAVLDPIWKVGSRNRKQVYQQMTDALGWEYHTGKTRSLEECQRALEAARDLAGARQ